jgi:hypothetical protein
VGKPVNSDNVLKKIIAGPRMLVLSGGEKYGANPESGCLELFC